VEFPRSKKLIKYPRVALTSASQDGYVVSSYEGTMSGVENYNVFNGIKTGADRWSPTGPAYTNGSWNSTQSNGTTVDVNGNTWTGEWLQIQLPNKIALKRHTILTRSTALYRRPKKGVILASTNGTVWNLVDSWSDLISEREREVSVDNTTHYDYFRLVSIELDTTVADAVRTDVQEWELFGTPEYDPEADGVDVVVKSVPNVPNTDWLEVYYDAKDLADGAVSSVNDLKPSSLGSAINSISVTNVTVSDKAFVFNGTSDIRSTVSTFTGDQPHTMSVWVNISILHTLGDGYICILAPSAGETTDKVSSIRYQNDGFNLQSWGNDIQMYNLGIQKNRWYHLVVVYDGGGVTTSSKRLYIDTLQNLQISTDNTTSNSINFTNTTLSLGSRVSGTSSHLTGSIANFRLFNRALTTDEIYQLYAYQKEDFGHGVLGMTLKAGNLHIDGFVGTSRTGGLIIPSGTTGELPSGVTGMIRYNTGLSKLQVSNGSTWITIGGVNATGGVITTADGYTIHTFLSGGTFTVLSGGEVEYLVVAGGGGGGTGDGGGGMGGGGAGGLMTGTLTNLTPDSYTIIVGEGGTGGIAPAYSSATIGTDSSISFPTQVIADGGGKGATSIYNDTTPGGSGGSGGGGSGNNVVGGVGGTGTSGPPRQGYNGGQGGNGTTSGSVYKGGGGGGAGAVGQSYTSSTSISNGLNGGIGIQSSINGTATYYAGGGGGGGIVGSWANTIYGGTGGSGGGGDGGDAPTSQVSTTGYAGTPNTGGGGGGGAYLSSGGGGGSGIVIIRYLQ